jgi:hypothetical protein
MQHLIQACRERVGDPPRTPSRAERETFHIPRPVWLEKGDGLRATLQDQEKLRDHGHVRWAAISMANYQLWQPGASTCPGLVVFSLDTDFDDRPFELREIATAVYDLGDEEQEDPQLDELRHHIVDELSRPASVPIPESLAGQPGLFVSSILLERAHLPFGYLAAPVFPVLVNHEVSRQVVVLPAAYWPEELTALYYQGLVRQY